MSRNKKQYRFKEAAKFKEVADPKKASAATDASKDPKKESEAAPKEGEESGMESGKDSAPKSDGGAPVGKDTPAPAAGSKKQADVKPADGAAAAGKDPSKLAPEADPQAGANSADEQKDQDLLKKMVGEYLSPDEMSSEDVMALATEIYGAFNQMGYPIDKAMSAVGYVMKYAQWCAAQQTPEADQQSNVATTEDSPNAAPAAAATGKPGVAPAGDKPQEGAPSEAAPAPGKPGDQAPPAKDGDAAPKEGEAAPAEGDAPPAADGKKKPAPAFGKEAAAPIDLKAENAALKERLVAIEAKEHLETSMREAKLPEQTKKACREALGDVRTKKYVDDKFKVFVEAYKSGLSVGSETGALPFVVSSEKKTNSGKKAISFSDCVK